MAWPKLLSIPTVALRTSIHTFLTPYVLQPPCSVRYIRSYAQSVSSSSGLPRDEDIRGAYIQLVNPNGGLDPPTPLRMVLQSIDRKESFVLQVAPPQPDTPAVCKIMNKQEAYRMEKARRKAQSKKKSHQVAKELELNWAIDGNDLAHRLNKLQEMLEKGMRVEILLAGKKRGRRATRDEAETVLRRIRERVAQVDGAKEWKAMEGRILQQATLFLEGKSKT